MAAKDFTPLPLQKRIMVGQNDHIARLLEQQGLSEAEYRGTDITTGDEYWQLLDPPISFIAVLQPVRRLIVWNIGSDPDQE